MDMSNSGGSTTSTSQATMTFSDWSVYQLNFLFDTYTITTKGQFAGTFFGVVMLSVLYHVIDCYSNIYNSIMLLQLQNIHNKKNDNDDTINTNHHVKPHGWLASKLIYSILIGIKYTISLFLMLIAMTMNPNLLLALALGYSIGCYITIDTYYDIKLNVSNNKYVNNIIKWWNNHSVTDHYVLIVGLLTYPISMATTYALIDRTCYYGAHVGHADDWQSFKGPYPGGFPTDWCWLETRREERNSLRTSFAVYYVSIFIVSLLMAWSHNNKTAFLFLHREVYHGYNITNGEVLVFAAVASIIIYNICLWWWSFQHHSWMAPDNVRYPWYFATQVSGRVCDVSLGLAFLPVSKNTAIQYLLGISYNSTMRFHQWMGWVVIIASVIHAAVYIHSTRVPGQTDHHGTTITHLFNIPDPSIDPGKLVYTDDYHLSWGNAMWMTVMGFYGTMIMFIPLVFAAIPFLRKNYYNNFYALHLCMHFGIVFLWLHSASNFYYMLPGIGMYIADITVRLYYRFLPTKVVNIVNDNGSDFYRIDFDAAIGLHQYKCGQFVRVCFPTINSFEWHTYTICGNFGNVRSIYLSKHSAEVSKGCNRSFDWSNSIIKNVKVGSPIAIDGPFGDGWKFDPLDVDTIVIFVAGTAISLGLNACEVLKHISDHKPNVHIVWSVRMNKESAIRFDGFDNIDTDNTTISIYHTSSDTANNDTTSLSNIDYVESNKERSHTISTVENRIDFDEWFSLNMPDDTNKHIGFIICGPQSFQKSAYNAVSSFNKRRDNDNTFVQVDRFDL